MTFYLWHTTRPVMSPTYSDAVVVGVPYDLVLDLLPPLHGLVHQDLVGVFEGDGDESQELLRVVTEAGAESSERVRRPNHHGIADLFSRSQGLGSSHYVRNTNIITMFTHHNPQGHKLYSFTIGSYEDYLNIYIVLQYMSLYVNNLK